MSADIKGKKKRDGISSPEKASTPSVPCEGVQQDIEGQKRPIVNDEILALQITEDDLLKVLKVNSTFDVKIHFNYHCIDIFNFCFIFIHVCHCHCLKSVQ